MPKWSNGCQTTDLDHSIWKCFLNFKILCLIKHYAFSNYCNLKEIRVLNLITNMTTLFSSFKKLQSMIRRKRKEAFLWERLFHSVKTKNCMLHEKDFISLQSDSRDSNQVHRHQVHWGWCYLQQLSTHRTLIAMRLPIRTKNRIIFPCASKSSIFNKGPKSTAYILKNREKNLKLTKIVMLTTLFSEILLNSVPLTLLWAT